MISDDEEEERSGRRPIYLLVTSCLRKEEAGAPGAREGRASSLFILEEELEVDLKDSLEEAHVGALVQTNLVLPDVDEQDLTGGQGKQGALPLKVLVLAALAAVRTLDVHDKDVVGHLGAGALDTLVLGHPNALCGLLALVLGHDRELGAEEVVEQGRLAGGLGAEDGDKMIIEAGLGDMFEL